MIDLGNWAGMGGESEYVEAPIKDGQGHLTYTMVNRYGQGLIFRLRPSGALFCTNPFYLVIVLIATFASLKIVDIIMDVIVQYLIPCSVSKLFKAKKSEIVSKADEDRELGMKAALAAAAFGSFDPDKNGLIEMEDIARVFGHMQMPGLDATKAHSMAWRIMHKTGYDTKHDGRNRYCLPSTDEQVKAGEKPTLSFADFVDLTSDAGFSFEHYIKHVRDAGTKVARDDAYYAETLASCVAAFDKVQGRGSLTSPAHGRKYRRSTSADNGDVLGPAHAVTSTSTSCTKDSSDISVEIQEPLCSEQQAQPCSDRLDALVQPMQQAEAVAADQ